MFQLRLKGASDRSVIAAAAALKAGLSGCAVIVNDRADLAEAAGADGVHLGQDDLPVSAARRLLGRRALVGVSAGSVREIAAAARARPDYISLGPAFATRTKRDAGPALGIAGVRRLMRVMPRAMTVLAVGGITSDNVGGLARAGVHVAAIASAWWTSRDPRQAAVRVLRQVQAANVHGTLAGSPRCGPASSGRGTPSGNRRHATPIRRA